ncbi:MAG: hypothetical protein CVV25_02395 [Ignavibacteriae bacterium HGW-Ignavibacteriae-4]|jgi:hypothetical protein|nr:MAG: hypothetical protein CVV25_02395 [Ignavibacteriae bacterium HGW-Ignavibacteriae-4]
MKILQYSILIIFILIFATSNALSKDIYSVSKFVSADVGKELIVKDDDYSKALSNFDLELRVHKAKPTLANLNSFTQEQVLEWTKTESNLLDSLTKVISDIAIEKGYNFILPDQIAFIKTTMEENKGAGGYTRLNYIVLSKDVFLMPKSKLKSVIAHELFHVISRYNPELRTQLYSVIGFTTCNPIEITTRLRDFTLSNPDAPNIDAYIILKNKSGEEEKCAMVLYSDKEYNGGAMFDYMKVGFLKLTKNSDNNMELFVENGKEQIFNAQEITGFFEQIGSNTHYIIHPEEIVASNFELLFDEYPIVNSAEILSNIEEILKNN